jgi:hypothetical protein
MVDAYRRATQAQLGSGDGPGTDERSPPHQRPVSTWPFQRGHTLSPYTGPVTAPPRSRENDLKDPLKRHAMPSLIASTYC